MRYWRDHKTYLDYGQSPRPNTRHQYQAAQNSSISGLEGTFTSLFFYFSILILAFCQFLFVSDIKNEMSQNYENSFSGKQEKNKQPEIRAGDW